MQQKNYSVSDFFINFLSVFFIVWGIWTAVPAIKNVYYVQMSPHWPEAKGKVISAEVEPRWLHKEDGPGQEYIARVWFGYTVDGKNYISKQLQFGQPYLKDRQAVEEKVKKYPRNMEVIVRYYPSDASIAAIEAAVVPREEAMKAGFGALAFLGGFIGMLGMIRLPGRRV